ncbi:UDP-2,3-diacylglucosamine diphosphatase [Candidatus Erwinia haradaeae]|uniref:UDP-2,3-diacylglucosamine hydrolase n=1 Tax=Candidatus Erwinia haradaeae TaxID=1922217 RepID=A0A451DA12_9GAMM|nr:UDP-2,3-diacylglucosamine diphosphatase [Candidatus Erwinia haradaeae]VFP83103.1 UDP-2,3-diacylglucosamine hydrolase [Candidatus Erwinia haradaeae]
MSKTLFISDLHLCDKSPQITAAFLYFLRHEAQYADALYILGDLFDSWIGDDDISPLHDHVACMLRRLSVRCHFLHGNRDFLLGKSFARRAGMYLMPDASILELYGQRVLIMHGDRLCTRDIIYQTYRKYIQTYWLKKLFLSLPLYTRKRIALKLRSHSQQANTSKDIGIMDVNPHTVSDLMCKNQSFMLIHGHTHRPTIHQFSINGQPAQRWVLGDWSQKGSMISVNHKDIQFITFSL